MPDCSFSNNGSVERYLRDHGLVKLTLRAALIDMDGTLYDSMPSHAAAWQQMMAEIGVAVTREEMFIYEGRTGRSQIDILFRKYLGRPATEQECSDLYRRKTEIFAAMPPVSPMPGAARMLDFLRSEGVMCVLVTGSGQRTLIDRLQADFPGVFAADRIISSRDVTHGKPDPEPYLTALSLAGVGPDEAIVIENAPLGVEAGHRAGIFTIGVNTGPIDPRLLVESGADVVFDSMAQCADCLPALFAVMRSTVCNV